MCCDVPSLNELNRAGYCHKPGDGSKEKGENTERGVA
jgi:hypothetical protein